MHENVIDIAGRKFGKLTVLKRESSAYHGVATWLCLCECGNKKTVAGSSLRRGNTQSCGCIKNNNRSRPKKVKIQMIGKKFGKLLVLGRAKDGNRGEVKWICACDCGEKAEIRGMHLRNGKTKSCGCLTVKKTINRMTKHGMARTPEYTAWKNMKRRCYAPGSTNYKNWGGRGIAVCDSWLKSFDNFYKDMGDRPSPSHSLDRIDNNGDYNKSNCRWATPDEQSVNKRRQGRKKGGQNANNFNHAGQQ